MDAIWAIFSSSIPYLLCIVTFLIFREQSSYLKKKSFVPGPSLVYPLLGNAIPLVRDPTKFWDLQTALSKTSHLGISANYIMGRYILFVRSTDLSRKILTNVRPGGFRFVVHPFGKQLFRENNLIYLMGEAHKDLRRRIAPNFTPRALCTYLRRQQTIIAKHFNEWLKMAAKSPGSVPLRLLCRELNLETSQDVFVGPYMTPKASKSFSYDYNLFNNGLLSFPIDLPGFTFGNAKRATARLVDILGNCAEMSMAKMKTGNEEPSCLADFWMQDELAAAKESGKPPLSCSEIGGHMFDFLFAAQDASTSSLLWAVALLGEHPKVLAKVRQEIDKIWSPESNTLITPEQFSSMKYADQVTKEVLRFRAPATMVPHVASQDFPLTEEYTIPKGTLVFPSVFESSFQGFNDPDQFDPDRFSEERQEHLTYKKYFLAFGVGSHQCAGQRYAFNQLKLFIVMFASLIDFKRDKTDGCDDIKYFPTICPKDQCRVFMSQRCTKFPTF